MTQVDFYITEYSDEAPYHDFICRLVEKAYRRKCKVYLHTANAEQAKHFDDLLWTYRASSFLPHTLANKENSSAATTGAASTSSPGASITIGHGDDIGDHNDVLINIANATPTFFSRFNRLAEVVMNTDAMKQSSRQRYRFYKDRGYPLNTHQISADKLS